MSCVQQYLSNEFHKVEGWCMPHLWQVIEPMESLQAYLELRLPIAEIGVYHGKFFIGLVKTKQTSGNLALDVFDMQRFNLDGAGQGNLQKFKQNLAATGIDLSNVEFVRQDSMTVTRMEIDSLRAKSGGFSFFSVDGCHRVEHTLNDVAIAMDLTDPRGIIFVDDYYNPDWPGVQEGICKLYHSTAPRWVPLLYTCNKLMLAHISYHNEYLNHVEKHLALHFPRTQVRHCDRFGYDTLTVQPAIKYDEYFVSPQ